jgi:hypothetical protein
VGATNTAIGSKLLQHQVLSSISILQGADILIHAYSNGQGNKTLDMLQEFVRLALQHTRSTMQTTTTTTTGSFVDSHE